MNTFSILNIGFSIISAALLFSAYVLFFKNVNRSWLAIGSCGLLLFSMSNIQLWHLDFLTHNVDLFLEPEYRFWLFMVPPMFYYFSRSILVPSPNNKPILILHLMPLSFNFIEQHEVAITLIFLVGMGYCLWFANLVYNLRAQRSRFKVEMFFFAFFSLLAALVLVFGVSIPYIDNTYFYYFYANSISLAYFLVVMALLVFPELLNELTAVATLSYTSSTLKGLNIKNMLRRLDKLMRDSKLFQNEGLNMAMVANEMDISSHQLSELINVHFGMSFSRYIREQRVQEAKALLAHDKESSILSISMETGFKSQSNFYVAFKEITSQSPGDYRKKLLG